MPSDPAGGTRLLSPNVRRAVTASHLDPTAIVPTGGRGRLSIADVIAVVGDTPPRPERFVEASPLDIRQRIAARMVPVEGNVGSRLGRSGC